MIDGYSLGIQPNPCHFQHLTRHIWQSPLVDDKIYMMSLHYIPNCLHILLGILEITNSIKLHIGVGALYHHFIRLFETGNNHSMPMLYKSIGKRGGNNFLTTYLEDLH